MKNIPHFVKREIIRLSKNYSSLNELYTADIEWLENGTIWLSGENLKLKNWFNLNTILFEKEFIKHISED